MLIAFSNLKGDYAHQSDLPITPYLQLTTVGFGVESVNSLAIPIASVTVQRVLSLR